ncbi:MAG: methionyl-tRNA formyltransferase, partial [Aestuariivirgaceae bacterium]
MGTPDFAVPTLDALIAAGHDIVAVYSQPPRAAGRGQAERQTPVHRAAERHGITVQTPLSLKSSSEHSKFSALDADVAVVVAYGLILPKQILQAPRHGCFNLHASLLPRWRGAAPIQRAIMAGDAESGACVMRMDEGLDTGDVCLAERLPITAGMTAGELHDKLSVIGASLICEALAKLDGGTLTFNPQPDCGVTYATKIDKTEASIDFA